MGIEENILNYSSKFLDLLPAERYLLLSILSSTVRKTMFSMFLAKEDIKIVAITLLMQGMSKKYLL